MAHTSGASRDEFATERRERIWRMVNERGRVRTSELAKAFGVTEPTIRKDIADLEAREVLSRTHGGAVARGPMTEVPVDERERKHVAEKQRIARACVGLLERGDAIFLDGGTTNLQIARALTELPGSRTRGVKVVTNSFSVVELLSASFDEPPILLGGRYRPQGRSFVGPLTIRSLEQFRVDTAFIGVTGINPDGVFVADLSEAELKGAVISRATRVVVPMDRSKIGLTDFVTVCPLGSVDTVVVDEADDQLSEWTASAGVNLAVASPELPAPE